MNALEKSILTQVHTNLSKVNTAGVNSWQEHATKLKHVIEQNLTIISTLITTPSKDDDNIFP